MRYPAPRVVSSIIVVRDGRVVAAHGNVIDAAEIARIVAQHSAER